MPTRKPKKRSAAGSRRRTSRARKAVPSKRKKASAKKQPARKGSPASATKKVGTTEVSAKRAKKTRTKARAGQRTVTRKAGVVIVHAVTTVRKVLVGTSTGAPVRGAVHGAKTAVAPESSPAGTASPNKSDEQTGGEPAC